MAAFNALGDGDFMFASEERDDTHFAQVNTNRVIGLFCGPRCMFNFGFITVCRFDADINFAGFDDFQCGPASLSGSKVFVNIDAITLDGRKSVFDFFGCVFFDGEEIVDFLDQQITAFLTESKERSELIIFFLKQQ